MPLSSSLQGLPKELICNIVEKLEAGSPSSVYKLLSIGVFKEAAESVIYRSIIIQPPPPPESSPWPRTKHLIERLLDVNDTISSHVRELELRDWPCSSFPEYNDETILEKILLNITTLHSFTWNTYQLIPKCILDTFHARFPTARLCYVNRTRGRMEAEARYRVMPLDLDLLGSPQLYSLDSTFFSEMSGLSRSELPVLSQVIAKAKRLRVLRFVCEDDNWSRNHQYTELEEVYGVPKNISLSKSTFGPLKELVFFSEPTQPHTFYDFTRSHCNVWKSCMDWSQLVKLDLGGQGPATFFKAFDGYVPNLKSLGFTLTRRSQEVTGFDTGVEDVRIIGSFLDSIKALEELCVTSVTEGFFPDLWSYIKRQGPTLRVLKTTSMWHADWKWTKEAIIELETFCPHLQSLSIELEPKCKLKADGDKRYFWPTDSFKALSRLSQLKHLNILIDDCNAGYGSYGQGTEPANLAVVTFVAFFRRNMHSQMRCLEFTARKAEYAPIQECFIHMVIAIVKRAERDDSPSPIDGGYEVELQVQDGRKGFLEKKVYAKL